LRLDGVFPDAAPSPGLSARAAAVLGWCSPKSSVPRQTVGHHARAAKYEMGPTAACEGCRGEVPRRLDIPPTGAFFSFPSYTHRPGRSGAHEPAGSGVDFRIPQNSFVWVSLKMGSRASKNPRVGSGVGHRSHREPNPAMTVFSPPLAALPPPFSYTHRPGRSGAHEPAGSGVDFPIPRNSFVWVSLKMGSRASKHAGVGRGPARSWVWAPQPSGAEASRCCLLCLPLAALPPPFSYTHRPGRSGAHEPAGSGVDFPIPRNSFVWRLLKMGSRARTRGERPAPTAACLGPRCWGAPVRPTLYPGLPTRLPYTPTDLPYTRPRHTASPNPPTLYLGHPHHTPQPAYPVLYHSSYIEPVHLKPFPRLTYPNPSYCSSTSTTKEEYYTLQ